MKAKELLNQKFKDNIPSEFEGEVWDDSIIEAMKEYARLKCAEQRKICAKPVNKYYDGEAKIIHSSDIINAPEPEFD